MRPLEVVLTWETEGDELSGTSGSMPVNPLIFKLLRLGKLARAIRMITMSSMLLSLQKLGIDERRSVPPSRPKHTPNRITCPCGPVHTSDGATDGGHEDPLGPFEIREEVFRYYGTWTRTMLSMFEILFANWGPPCRILVDHVHEAFSIFFLVYRCVLGFAVLNVDLAFREKQRDIASYTRKIRKLFQTMDTSGDGTINYEEFSKLVSDPKLNFWIGQLELEYHDLMSLFEFLDNGDGEITFSEFIEGATRLRGQAKALDIWRMETKVEVLFEEVLNILAGPGQGSLHPPPASPALSDISITWRDLAVGHSRQRARRWNSRATRARCGQERGLGPREGVSSDFMGLVEKLVHQHQTEMAMCGKKKSFDIPPVTTEWERLCSAGSRFSKRSQERGEAFSPAAVLMRERKHDLKELDASKLLEAFDEHALQEVILSGTLLGDLPVNPLLFKLLRIGKLARAIRMISMILGPDRSFLSPVMAH
eukprot:g23535.t1